MPQEATYKYMATQTQSAAGSGNPKSTFLYPNGGDPNAQNPGEVNVAAPGATPNYMSQADASAKGITPTVSPAVSTPGSATTPTTSATTTQPNPATTQVGTGLPGNTIGQGSYNAQTGALTLPNTPSPAAQGFAKAKGPAPQDSGVAKSAVADLTPKDNTPPALPPSVANYLNPETNPDIKDSIQAIRDTINPPETRDRIASEYSKLIGDQNELAADKIALMNTKQLMAGTEQDIRDEITKANGFATNSQVMALTVARNATLQSTVTQLEDQLQIQQNQVSTDTNIYNNDKATASSEATTNMGIWEHLQTAYQNTENAYKDGIKTMIASVGISGLYNGLINTDPSGNSVAKVAASFGWTSAQLKDAATNDLKTQKAQQALQQGNLNLQNKQLQSVNLGLGLQGKQLDIQSKQLDIQKKELEASQNPADKFAMPGEADKSKVLSAIPKLDPAKQKSIDMGKLASDPKYFYAIKAKLGL